MSSVLLYAMEDSRVKMNEKMLESALIPLKALVLMGGGMSQAYWYDCGELERHLITIGVIVEVPLRSRIVPGVVLEVGFPDLGFATKPIRGLAPDGIRLPQEWMEFIKWISQYYLTPLPSVLQACLPKVATRYLFRPPKRKVRKAQKVSDPIDALGKGPSKHLSPTAAQQAALAAMIPSFHPFVCKTFLLHGVTGSGKTLVYLHLAEKVLALGRQVLVLLPEIALTPQTIARFESFLGRKVPALHSGLSDRERRDLWKRMFTGEIDIVIGTRSAVLAPLHRLGLIIIDEEHDGSYKQTDPAPRYHARDLALFRGKQSGCPVVLGSATPSVETYHGAITGKYTLLSLEERATAVALPQIEIVDMKEQYALRGSQPISIPLRDAVQSALDHGEQAILLLNRRGYSPRQACQSCGETRMCPACAVALVFHRENRKLLCHYCGFSSPQNMACSHCGCKDFLEMGLGIEKVEENLRKIFPQVSIARLDRDSTARQGETEKILARFQAREIRILLGTQMVAKGHDFPGVNVVGVLDADAGLEMADFRAEERAFQLITQVAGRAGRHIKSGRVFLQTLRPTSVLLDCALNHDYKRFFAKEIERRHTLGYPPFRRLLLCEMLGSKGEEVQKAIQKFADLLQANAKLSHADILGPAQAALTKIRHEYRMHILIKGQYANQLEWLINQALERFNPQKPKNIKLRLDRDPVSLL